MKPLLCWLAGAAIVTFAGTPAWAWSHSGRYGSASGGGGSWSASGWRGGSASGGDGSWNAHGAYGGSASGGDGSWSAHGADGGSAYHTSDYYGGTYHGTTTAYDNDHYYGGSYSYYHPPTVTNNYYGGGCYDCGGWSTAGAVAVGAAAGMAIGSAATANAYNAGVVAGSTYPVGAIYPYLPVGCVYRPIAAAYECSGVWMRPAYGANGVYYRVVPGP